MTAQAELPHCTEVVALASADAALAAITEALFTYCPQLAPVVALVTCTVAFAAGAKLPRLQLSVPPAIEHDPGPLYAGLMLHPIPLPAGNGSLKLAELADCVPL